MQNPTSNITQSITASPRDAKNYRFKPVFLFVLLAAVLLPFRSFCGDVVVTKDGKRVEGVLVGRSQSGIAIQTQQGIQVISQDNVQEFIPEGGRSQADQPQPQTRVQEQQQPVDPFAADNAGLAEPAPSADDSGFDSNEGSFPETDLSAPEPELPVEPRTRERNATKQSARTSAADRIKPFGFAAFGVALLLLVGIFVTQKKQPEKAKVISIVLGVLFALCAASGFALVNPSLSRPVLVKLGILPSPVEEVEAFLQECMEIEKPQEFADVFSNQTATIISYPLLMIAPLVGQFQGGATGAAMKELSEKYPVDVDMEEFLDQHKGSGRRMLSEIFASFEELSSPEVPQTGMQGGLDVRDIQQAAVSPMQTMDTEQMAQMLAQTTLVEIDPHTVAIQHPDLPEGVEIQAIYEDSRWRIHLPNPEQFANLQQEMLNMGSSSEQTISGFPAPGR